MDEKASRRAFRVSALTAALAIVFTLFFQLSKAGPFREVNPFLDDPYDAVGSIAFQVALLVGVLTFARSLRLIHGELPEARLRFIARGNVLVLGAVLLALVGDTLAVIAHPVAPSAASDELRLALGGMILFAALCASAFAASFPRVREVRPD
ncbi:MAG TPA: hypothetical protein VEO56_14365, partial [Bacteroidota bacterium]|nr:hypothetical protein [Bacteroidota bacterium]